MKLEKVRNGIAERALTVALGLCIVGAADAQSTTGAISGSAPAGARVTITSNSGLNRTVVTDEKGRYSASSLPVGTYTVTVGEGRRDVLVTVGGNSNVSFASSGATTLGAINVTAMAADSIDVRSVSSSTVFTAQEIQRLPLARSAEAIALLAPGAVAGNPVFFGNAVSLGGASVAENAYYINGFFTGNPMTNVGGYTLPYGSIEQQETYTGGYSAKYGRSDGGVLNQIGKSGSNEFHFGAQVTWTPKGLRAGTPDRHLPNESLPAGYEYQDPTLVGRLLSRGDRNESWGETYSAYFSGPLVRDRLFGFLSLEQERSETSVYPTVLGSPQSLRDTTKNPKLYAKLNWNINDSNLLELTYMAQRKRYQGDYYVYDFAEDVEGERNGAKPNEVKENDEFSIIKYTGYLTDTLTFNAMYGHSRLRYSSVPTLTGFDHVTSASLQNPAYWPAGTPASGITNPQAASNGTPGADDYGDGLRLELEWVLGRHTLTGGIDNQKFEAKNEGVDMLIDRWIYHSTNSPGRAINAALDVGAPNSRYFVRKYIYSNSTSMSLEQKGWYLEDKWQVTDNLLLSLGIRNDKFTNKNNTGAAYVDTGDQWAPRLGFSWDVFGDSSFKLFGNAGRYYLALPQAVAVRGASSSTFTSEYFRYSGIDENGAPTGLDPILDLAGTGPAGPVSSNHETGQPKDAGSFAPTDLKSSYQDEFIVGFQARLNENWSYGAKATYRD
ncbi:MAG: TonB-dependent receptor, partial [Stenotrophomonas sp.]